MSFTSKSPSETYKDITYVDNNNSGVTTSLKTIKTGEGTSTALSVSDRSLAVKSNTDNTAALDIKNASGTSKLLVDTTNNQVKALGIHVNTQYANFSTGYTESASAAAGTHEMLTFESANYGNLGVYVPNLGTGTDPATTFTTSISNAEKAGDLVPCLWYVPDNIAIDSVHSLEGADAASGDTTRMHCLSFDFTSGATACLTEGVLVGHSNDQTNAGSEQPYLNTWTVDSASVTSGKVLVATFDNDSINSDYSVQIKVKYHLT